jgi:methylenetetrahydrofolate reductase (NADPH)
MRTSLEVVPRSAAALFAAIELIRNRYPGIDTVNVPDLANCELSSIDAVTLIVGRIPHRIPHLRARDFDVSSAPALAERLRLCSIDEVIVIAGDTRSANDTGAGFEPTALMQFLADRLPNLRIYAAIDPHRYRDDGALAANIAQKRAAGAAGFFTQPLFTLRDIERVGPLLQGATVFWGLSPVVSAASRAYWERVNRVAFPADFVPTLKWNQAFALRLLSEAAARGDNAYLMPIKVDIDSYLAPLEARFAGL